MPVKEIALGEEVGVVSDRSGRKARSSWLLDSLLLSGCCLHCLVADCDNSEKLSTEAVRA